jgi:hypothetical protein
LGMECGDQVKRQKSKVRKRGWGVGPWR